MLSKMAYTRILILFYVLTCWSIIEVNAACTVSDFEDCSYVITCEIYPTSTGNPGCNNPPNVTLIIQNTKLEILSAGYFSSTNFDSRVRHFKTTNCDWNTLESNAFKYYTRTISMDLSHTNIETIKIESFTHLVNLKYLDLSDNYIENLSPRSLFFAPGSALEYLDLSGNRFESLDNNVFNTLPRLLELNLKENNIKYMLDDCFSNLRSLTILHLQNNKITSLNTTMIVLKSLKHLDLSYNRLKMLSGYEINRLVALEYLNVSSNVLEVIEPNCFSQALNLQIVDLSNNRINSPIESFMFMNNKLLKYLNFYNNTITTIKDASFALNSIEYLNLEHNNITGDLRPDTLKGLVNITALDLSQQSITNILQKSFSSLSRLRFLNLSRNFIKTIDNTSFEFTNGSSLVILDVSHNFLSSLYFLQNFTMSLIELYLNNNNILFLSNNIFSRHIELKILDISFNAIAFLEPFSLPLQKLQNLIIHNNIIGGNITSGVFSPAPYLRYLDLSHFLFKRINENSFMELQLLTKLNLSYNALEYIHAENFMKMEKMYSLDLSNNKLSKFELNTDLNNLKAIYLQNNNFTRLPRIFSNYSEVLYIDMSFNSLTNLENIGLRNVSNLKVLHLSNNNITNFNNPDTNSLAKLSDLTLGSNKIHEIKLCHFKELVSLDLSNNTVNFINSSMFDGLSFLQSLDLSHNNISNIMPGAFKDLKILKLLNLSSNSITKLRYGGFRGLNRTEVIDLSNNKLETLDIHVFHVCTELNKLVIDYNFIKYIDVEQFFPIVPKLTILSIGGNPIACKEIVRTVQRERRLNLEVTSIHKIFHEDNVHGIKCGDLFNQSTEIAKLNVTETDRQPEEIGHAHTKLLVAFCCILVICLVIGFVFYIARGRHFRRRLQREEFNNSFNVSTLNSDGDLLS